MKRGPSLHSVTVTFLFLHLKLMAWIPQLTQEVIRHVALIVFALFSIAVL